jgi:hypothetical protein
MPLSAWPAEAPIPRLWDGKVAGLDLCCQGCDTGRGIIVQVFAMEHAVARPWL